MPASTWRTSDPSSDRDDTCKLRIPLDQKIHVVEMYPDQGHSLMAVGLSSSLAIVSLVLDDDDSLSGYQVQSQLCCQRCA